MRSNPRPVTTVGCGARGQLGPARVPATSATAAGLGGGPSAPSAPGRSSRGPSGGQAPAPACPRSARARLPPCACVCRVHSRHGPGRVVGGQARKRGGADPPSTCVGGPWGPAGAPYPQPSGAASWPRDSGLAAHRPQEVRLAWPSPRPWCSLRADSGPGKVAGSTSVKPWWPLAASPGARAQSAPEGLRWSQTRRSAPPCDRGHEIMSSGPALTSSGLGLGARV